LLPTRLYIHLKSEFGVQIWPDKVMNTFLRFLDIQWFCKCKTNFFRIILVKRFLSRP